MAGDTVITVVGNLVDDPELRFTPSGAAVAKFRVASTPRYMDRQTNEWKDGDSLFLTCNVWRQAAENVAESLQRGMRVIVQGRLKQRSYETKEGEKRTVLRDRGRRGRSEPAQRHGQGRARRRAAAVVASAATLQAARPRIRGPRRHQLATAGAGAAAPAAAPVAAAVVAPAKTSRPSEVDEPARRLLDGISIDETDQRSNGSISPMAKPPIRKPKKKVCVFCKDKITYVDYKDTALLRKFISDRGKIRARRVTGNCTQHQRDVATAIKNSREMALLPYTSTAR